LFLGIAAAFRKLICYGHNFELAAVLPQPSSVDVISASTLPRNSNPNDLISCTHRCDAPCVVLNV
jgi:hypothetical protein